MKTDNGPLVVGITGNIGVGKSTFIAMLAAKGAYIIDMDQTTRKALHSSGPGYSPVVEEFGQQILHDSGEIDRSHLGGIVFGDADRLAALEKVLHPIVFEMAKAELAEAQAPLVAIEAIKLLEAGRTSQLCDQVWVVTAPANVQMRRLTRERNMSEDDARQRMSSQTSEAWKVSQADRVIDNSGTVQELALQVEQIWSQVMSSETKKSTD